MWCFIPVFSNILQQIKVFFNLQLTYCVAFVLSLNTSCPENKTRCPWLKVRRGTGRFGVHPVDFAGTFTLGYQGE